MGRPQHAWSKGRRQAYSLVGHMALVGKGAEALATGTTLSECKDGWNVPAANNGYVAPWATEKHTRQRREGGNEIVYKAGHERILPQHAASWILDAHRDLTVDAAGNAAGRGTKCVVARFGLVNVGRLQARQAKYVGTGTKWASWLTRPAAAKTAPG